MNMPAAQTAGCSVSYAGMPIGVIQWDLMVATAITLLDSQGNPILVGGMPPTFAALTSSFTLTKTTITRGIVNLNLANIQALMTTDPNSYQCIWLAFNGGGQLSVSVRIRISSTNHTSTPLLAQLRSFRITDYDVQNSVAQPKSIAGLPPNFSRGTEAVTAYTADFTDGTRTLQAAPFADTDLSLTSTSGLQGTLPMQFRVTRAFNKDSVGNNRNYSKTSELLSSLTF